MPGSEDFDQDAIDPTLWSVDQQSIDGMVGVTLGFSGGPSEASFGILSAVTQRFANHVLDGGHDSITFNGDEVSATDVTAALDLAIADVIAAD